MMTESEIKIEQFNENLLSFSEIAYDISDEEKRQLFSSFPNRINNLEGRIADRTKMIQECEKEIEQIRKRIQKHANVIDGYQTDIRDLQKGLDTFGHLRY